MSDFKVGDAVKASRRASCHLTVTGVVRRIEPTGRAMIVCDKCGAFGWFPIDDIERVAGN